MRQLKLYSPLSAIHAGLLSGMLFLASVLPSVTASAQTHSVTDHAPAPANLRETPIAQLRTPVEVVSGAAKLIGRYTPEAKLRLTLGLNPPNKAAEEKFLAELQDKKSPNFHKYLTAEQWNARFAPSAADEQLVVDWLNSNGMTVTKRYPNRLVVNAEATSQVVEKAFAVKVNSYQVGATAEFSNDHDPVIPSHLAGILRSVGGLNSIQRVHAPHEGDIRQKSLDYASGAVAANVGSRHADGDKAAFDAAKKASEDMLGTSNEAKSLIEGGTLEPGLTNGLIDPSDIFSSYGYDYGALHNQGHCCNPTHNSSGTTPTTSIAIATSGDFADSDIQGFQGRYSYLAYNYSRNYIDGTPSCCNDETTLDVEWAIATSNSMGSYLDTSHIWVYEGADNKNSTFTDVYNSMLSDGHARIFSTSWGCAELSCTPSSTMDTDHNIFNAMLGQGWTILALSHDYGATGGCDAALRVSYPASDPDVIAVGGTTLSINGDGTFNQETGWQGGTAAGSCSKNNGGSGGGCSNYYAAPGYQSKPYCGTTSRSVPDIAVNAGAGQNYFYNGAFHGVGGTSISTPQVAGFMAQENAYLLAIGLGCGSNFNSVCAPIGQADYALYTQGYGNATGGYAPHNPYYDITSGCNSNDITAAYNTGYYCAGTGYDAVTGWGSFNALQLAWSINWYYTGDFGAPKVTFSGPAVSTTANTWFNTDQNVSWTVADTNNGTYPSVGVAGFSQAWDSAFSDPGSEAHQGAGNSFYSGPQFPNATSGYLALSWAGQGCHYATVDAWDNTGLTSGNQYYYWLCYDTVAPTVAVTNSPAPNSKGYWKQNVQVSLSASDAGGSKASGVSKTYYAVDSTSCNTGAVAYCAVYNGPFTIAAPGFHYITYFTKDVAGNFSPFTYDYLYIDEVAPVTTATLAGTLSGSVYDTAVQVTLHGTDNFSGIGSTSYQLNGGPITTYAGPISVSSLGSHTVKFFSTDNAGNVETAKTVTFSISAPTTTTLTISPNPANSKQVVTLQAAVAAGLGATPTGTVTFKNANTTLGAATIVGGIAKITLTTLPFGSDTLTAYYPGATNILASTSAGVVEVYKQATSTSIVSSLNPSAVGQPVTFTATVTPGTSGTPTGGVQFFDGATLLGQSTLSSGKASYIATALPAGTDSIHAVYVGLGIYSTSTSPVISQTVKKGTTVTAVAASINPSQYLQNVTFTATVTSPYGVPTGTITFQNNGATLGTGTLSAGKATFSTTALGVGTRTITAVYAGNTNYLASTSAGLSDTTGPAKTTTKVTSSLNPSSFDQPVTLTAIVASTTSGTPTGTVTFKEGATTLATRTLSGGIATLAVTTLLPGTDSITAVYSGTPSYLTSTSTALTQTVKHASTTTTLVSSLNPSAYGETIKFTATVASIYGTPTGTVTFQANGASIGTATLSAGKATLSTSALLAGTRTITAVYATSADYLTSTSAGLTEVTQGATTTTKVTSSLDPSNASQSVTLTATVTTGAPGTPTGTVTFKDGATTLVSRTLAGGKATLVTTTLAPGSHSITAVYASSSANYLTSTSAALSQVVH